MPQSLTNFIQQLSPLVGASVSAIYERQRALVRLGMLPQPVGRGRGSGAEASYEHVSLLLISLLATDSLSEMDHRVRATAEALSDTERCTCPLTGAARFVDALATILRSKEIGGQVAGVTVARSTTRVHILFRKPGKKKFHASYFGRDGMARRPIQIEANINYPVLKQIRLALSQAVDEA